MAAKGTEAKEKFINKVIAALGAEYLGTYDKKYYFASSENGETVQIAVSLTCPKTPIEFSAVVAEPDGDWDFTDDKPKTANSVVVNAPAAEITEEEIKNLSAMMERLGL